MLHKLSRSRKEAQYSRESLILSSDAYRKLVWFRDQKKTEVGAMAISKPEDPLFVTDFEFLPQECTSVKTDFDTDAQNEWMETKLIDGHNPDNFARIWAHTHPGASATPSGTDWDTFQEAMGEAAWGVMLILGTSNEFVCVFRCHDQMLNIPVEVEQTTVPEDWFKELDNIKPPKPQKYVHTGHQQLLGYGGYNQGGHSYGTAKKRYKLHLPFWDDDSVLVRPAGFVDAIKKLPGKPIYSAFQQFNPSFEEIMEFGPVKTLNVIKEMYQQISDNNDERRVKQACERVGRTLFDDPNGIIAHDVVGSLWWEPIALLAALQDKELTQAQYEGISDEVTKYVYFNKSANEWYLKSSPNVNVEIPKWLTSGTPIDRETAYSALMSLSIHYPEHGEKFVDKACRKLIRNFLKSQKEYFQCQKDHEANVS